MNPLPVIAKLYCQTNQLELISSQSRKAFMLNIERSRSAIGKYFNPIIRP